jgi:molybdate transport system substrate-binding protein
MYKLILLLLATVCTIYANTITIAVAANVSYAIDDLLKEFKKTNPDINVRVTLGSSGKLTAQIKHGAPYDLFMAANMKYPNALYKSGIAKTTPVVYAQGAIAMLSVKDIDLSSIEILKDPSIKKITLTNPKTAPYGQAALEAMKSANIYDDIKKRLVYAETVSQAVSYTVSATDVGFIAKSSLYSPKMKRYTNFKEVDTKLYTPIDQGVVIIKDNKDVRAFYDFLLSSRSKDILKAYGYLIP